MRLKNTSDNSRKNRIVKTERREAGEEGGEQSEWQSERVREPSGLACAEPKRRQGYDLPPRDFMVNYTHRTLCH